MTCAEITLQVHFHVSWTVVYIKLFFVCLTWLLVYMCLFRGVRFCKAIIGFFKFDIKYFGIYDPFVPKHITTRSEKNLCKCTNIHT